MPITGMNYWGDLRELLITAVQMEATALKVGITYSTKIASHAATYLDTMNELGVRAMRDPMASRNLIQEGAEAYKRYLRDLAGLPGQAVVDFNMELESLRRRTQPRAAGAAG